MEIWLSETQIAYASSFHLHFFFSPVHNLKQLVDQFFCHLTIQSGIRETEAWCENCIRY